MKKTFLIAALALIAGAATAQQNQIHWGIKARYTFAKLNETFSDPSFGTISGNSGNVKNVDIGAFAEINIAKNAVFQPGLSYIQKGGAGTSQETNTSGNIEFVGSEIRLNYLEIPLNVLYNVPLKPGKIFVGMGPYAAIALSAKNKQTTVTFDNQGNSTQDHSTQSIKLGSGQDELKRMDFGINALLGFRLNNGLEIGGGMGFGLANLSNVSALKTHTQTISISAGYFF